MSKVIKGHLKNACLFDESKECPARKASVGSMTVNLSDILEHACPICPIRLKMQQ